LSQYISLLDKISDIYDCQFKLFGFFKCLQNQVLQICSRMKTNRLNFYESVDSMDTGANPAGVSLPEIFACQLR